jgi:hypothetical protein
MSETCSTHGKIRNEHQILYQEPERRDHKEFLHVDRKKILKLMLRKMGCDGVDGIHTAQNKNRRQR